MLDGMVYDQRTARQIGQKATPAMVLDRRCAPFRVLGCTIAVHHALFSCGRNGARCAARLLAPDTGRIADTSRTDADESGWQHGERALIVVDREAPTDPSQATFVLTKLTFVAADPGCRRG